MHAAASEACMEVIGVYHFVWKVHEHWHGAAQTNMTVQLSRREDCVQRHARLGRSVIEGKLGRWPSFASHFNNSNAVQSATTRRATSQATSWNSVVWDGR